MISNIYHNTVMSNTRLKLATKTKQNKTKQNKTKAKQHPEAELFDWKIKKCAKTQLRQLRL